MTSLLDAWTPSPDEDPASRFVQPPPLEPASSEEAPKGAVCERHPAREAMDLCARCGSFTCSDCARFSGMKTYCATCPVPAEDAGLDQRFAGMLLDALFIYAPALLAFAIATDPRTRAIAPALLFWGACLTNLVLAATRAQSFGKALLGMRIVRASDDGKAEWWRVILLRQLVPGLVFAIPFVGSIFALVDAVSILRGDNRCFHDDLARTRVVRTR